MAIEVRSSRKEVSANQRRVEIMSLEPSIEEKFKIIAIGGKISNKGTLKSFLGETQLDELAFEGISDVNHPIPRNYEVPPGGRLVFEFDELSGTTNTVVIMIVYDRIPA
jgi:hypothetical protein